MNVGALGRWRPSANVAGPSRCADCSRKAEPAGDTMSVTLCASPVLAMQENTRQPNAHFFIASSAGIVKERQRNCYSSALYYTTVDIKKSTKLKVSLLLALRSEIKSQLLEEA